jgi:hypothetical protein
MAVVQQSTLDTIDDYIDDARTLLQDTVSPYRYDDPSLITAMNVTLLEGRRLRPDLFVYNRNCGPGGVQHFIGKDGTQLVMEPQFRLAFLHGMIGHALERDQEDIQDQRAAAFMAIFTTLLVGKQVSTDTGQPPQRPGG